ncbi:MAG: hypothetical protein IJ701_04520 [Bacteroidales bacterium]|nr:hypothetical protein [Bacteroidales bacterium]
MYHRFKSAIGFLLLMGVMAGCSETTDGEPPVKDPNDFAPIIIVYQPPRPPIHKTAPAPGLSEVTCTVMTEEKTVKITFARPVGPVSVSLENLENGNLTETSADGDNAVLLPLDEENGLWVVRVLARSELLWQGRFTL